MEILLTFLAEVDYAFNERPKSLLSHIIVEEVSTKRSGSLQDLNTMETEVRSTTDHIQVENQHMRSQSIDVDWRGEHRLRTSSEGKRKAHHRR